MHVRALHVARTCIINISQTGMVLDAKILQKPLNFHVGLSVSESKSGQASVPVISGHQ